MRSVARRVWACGAGAILMVAMGGVAGASGMRPGGGGTALYVSVDGDDGNVGSRDAPFRTLQKAADVAVPGTVVHVAPGGYAGDVVLAKAGKPGSWITFLSEVRHAAVLSGRFAVQREYVRVAGFDITGPHIRDGMDVTASNTVIQDNEFHDIHKFEPNSDGGSGLTVFTDDYEPLENVVVDGNHVYDIGLSVGDNQLVQGIYISVPCRGCAVVNNLVHQVADFGIHSYHRPRYWLVANNTVFNNGRGILTGPDFTVLNNISFGNQASNYDVRGTATMSHNLSFGSGSARLPGVVVADPRFVNYRADGSGDYHLAMGSPGIDGGTAAGAPRHDIDGRRRPQGRGYDIGAYEQ
ncbi:DUF1565 domain-containing protein [Amycolatopsis sp. NPDC059021]|uniref:DUF1565 domain-containing protein n=1 Tax=Amycolatopsis sp. NPDC059021 TaxID=3346704 RepID=UPI003671F112